MPREERARLANVRPFREPFSPPGVVFGNRMEYDLARKEGTDAYYLLKERVTGTTVRVITDDKLLSETFWNNWHGIY